MKKVIVIGGGPAGMMAAIQSARNNQVLLLEKNKQLGKKLLLTGHGRCNVTNRCDEETFLTMVNTNAKFLYSAIHSFSSNDMIRFLEDHSCPLKEEDNHRMFPVTDHSKTILDTLVKLLEEENVIIHNQEEVISLIIEKDICIGVKTNKDVYYADTIILCTGGNSLPVTGSSGDVIRLLENTPHTIKPLQPALVAVNVKEEWVKSLKGLTLQNVCLQAGKKKYTGDLLFTHFGISGPMVLNMSSKLNFKGKELPASIDLFYEESLESLEQKVIELFSKNQNKFILNTLQELLPHRYAAIILKQAGIDENQVVHQIKKNQRKQIVYACKNQTITLLSLRSFNEAMITKGGISTKEIDPKTMESKIIKNLKFAGEVIDVDARTGGYNLQIAWATGYVAGND